MVQERDDDGLLDGVPWRHRTRQEQGRKTEQVIARERGLRQHPNSGAGRIKDDASDEECVYEIKDARKSYTLNGVEMKTTHVRAIRQGKRAVWVVVFDDLGIEVEMKVNQRKKKR